MLAILDPFSGIAGDMFLGALVDCGLEREFLESLPSTLGLDGVGVRIQRVQRCGIGAVKVDFDIPPQPHGRHLRALIEIVERSSAPDAVKARATEAFRLIASVEADIHGTTVERVHLHEVGAVDAILDVVGVVWGLHLIGVDDVRCGTIALGDGFVDSAHGRMPVPAPATARILEGQVVSGGPPDSGELTTPTGAALVRVLSQGGPPARYVPRRVGYGAGTRELAGRPNILRLSLADAGVEGGATESLVLLAADIDDATPEALAAAAETLRQEGALDVTQTPVGMKKGRVGTRIEALSTPATADALEAVLLMQTPTIGVRRIAVMRRALERHEETIKVQGQRISVKSVRLPDGTIRVKPEFEDVRAAALATGRTIQEMGALALAEALAAQDRL